MRTTCTILILLAIPLFLLAQQPKWEGGVFLGFSNYQGDLTKTSWPEFSENSPALGIMGRYHSHTMWAVRGNLFYGKLKGSDFNYFNRKGRGFTFKTTLIELDLMGEFEPLGDKRYNSGMGRFKRLVSPYIHAGLGVAFVNPKTDYSQTQADSLEEEIEKDRNADNSKVRMTIPAGLGVKVDLEEYWLIAVEISFRYPFTDYLDGVSESGNPNKNDWYIFWGLTFTHRFP